MAAQFAEFMLPYIDIGSGIYRRDSMHTGDMRGTKEFANDEFAELSMRAKDDGDFGSFWLWRWGWGLRLRVVRRL